MQINFYAPIVLFVYNRPWHTQQTVEALLKNQEIEKSDLIVYSDAAKTEEQESSVQAVRDYVDTISGFKSLKVIKQESNKGLADSIISGVTEVVNEYGRIIVLEDDIVTSPYFLRYMNEALEFYKDEEKVMHISGYIYPIKSKKTNETFFIKPTSCWGWATWKESWSLFEKKPQKQEAKFSEIQIKDFDLNNTGLYWSQLKLNISGDLNTWAIFWYISVYINKGLSLHPVSSLTLNIGHDGSGENCGDNNAFRDHLVSYTDWKFQTKISESVFHRSLVEKYLKSTRKENFKCKLIKMTPVWFKDFIKKTLEVFNFNPLFLERENRFLL